MTPETKRCAKCHRVKSLSEFHAYRGNRKQAYCKPCARKAQAEWLNKLRVAAGLEPRPLKR